MPDGFSDCAADVPVKVQRRAGGSWRLVGTTQSANDGAFVVPGTDEPGRYRALAKKVTLPVGRRLPEGRVSGRLELSTPGEAASATPARAG